jgi:hypothetical protein
MLLLIFVRPKLTTAGSVTASSTADPVDFEEMAAEQNHCPAQFYDVIDDDITPAIQDWSIE